MYSKPLEERRRALEDEFFQKHDAELIEQLRAKREHDEARRELARTCGVHDEAVLEALLEVGIEADTFVALALVPLVGVGWANGTLERDERKALLDAAHECGIESGSHAHELLDVWLARKPKQALLEAWESYAQAVGESVSPDQRALLRDDFVARAQKVAAAAGGILGIGAVSKAEQAVIEEIGRAFG